MKAHPPIWTAPQGIARRRPDDGVEPPTYAWAV
jgi:hypothetical protein